MMGVMVLAGLTMVWGVSPQPARSADGDDGTTTKTVDKKGKAPSNRLPPYYSKVVDQQQREKIYVIQNEYRPKIAAARKALETLIKEQIEKTLAVLTPEQQKKVQDAAATAKKKRATAASTEPTATPAALSKPAATALAK
jgi:hypothetical protein